MVRDARSRVSGFKQQARVWMRHAEQKGNIDLGEVGANAERHSKHENRLEQTCGSGAGSSFLGSLNELSLEELVSWGGNGVCPYAD